MSRDALFFSTFVDGIGRSSVEGSSLRYNPVFPVLVVGFLTLGCVRLSSECMPMANCRVTGNVLSPGSYEVIFVANHGSKAGQNTTGKLVLRTSSPDDVSPRTREAVAESKPHRLYGFIEFDFAEIGAPILGDTVAPAPNSTDPVYPGVLVIEDKKAVTLWVATLLNLRDDLRTGVLPTDGSGIVLYVGCLTPKEFSGTWGPAGIVTDGGGYFCARRRPD